MRSCEIPSRALRALFLVVLAACGSPPASPEDAEVTVDVVANDLELGVSGGRLRVRRFVAEGGAAHFYDFWDSRLEVPCRFARADDGQLRCLPYETTFGGLFGSGFCDDPLVADHGCGVGRYLREPLSDGPEHCAEDQLPASRFSVWERGEPYDGRVWSDADGRCQTTDAVGDAFHRVAPVPAEELVAATLEPRVGAGRLGRVALVADDGATRRWAIWDAELDTHCNLEAQGADALCLPTRTYVAWGDAECGADPVAPVATRVGVCGAARVAVDFRYREDERCVLPHVYSLGERRIAAQVWGSQFDLGCEAWTDRDIEVWSLSRDDSIVAHLARVAPDPAAAARLAPVYFAEVGAPDAAMAPDAGETVFFDRELDVACQPQLDEAGTYRCVPRGLVRRRETFADAACTEPSVAETPGCDEARRFAIQSASAPCGGPRVVSIRPILRRSSLRYERRDERCVLLDGGSYVLGDPIDATELASLELVTE